MGNNRITRHRHEPPCAKQRPLKCTESVEGAECEHDRAGATSQERGVIQREIQEVVHASYGIQRVCEVPLTAARRRRGALVFTCKQPPPTTRRTAACNSSPIKWSWPSSLVVVAGAGVDQDGAGRDGSPGRAYAT